MCGFTFALPKSNEKEQDFKLAHSFNQWRGSDKTTLGIFSDCYMAFSLLSFVQGINEPNTHPSNSSQPYSSPNGDTITMFNGEIYNYQRLKSSHGLSTAMSECAVISEGYSKIGLNFLSELDGMFAICLYDKNNHLVHLSRDYFGQKPLYYNSKISSDGSTSIYASTSLKTVSILSGEELRPEFVAEWIDLGFTIAPHTIYNNVYKVAPGETVTISTKTGKIYRSYQPQRLSSNFRAKSTTQGSINKSASLLCNSISEDIKSTLTHGDVKSALMLSKGIDSSVIEILAAPHISNSIDVISMDTGNGDAWDSNEKTNSYFTKVASTIDLQSTIVDYLTQAKRGLNPCSDIGMLPLFQLLSAYPKRKSAFIGGDGADELLFGYGKYKHLQNYFTANNSNASDSIRLWYKLRGSGYLSLDQIEERLRNFLSQQDTCNGAEKIRALEIKSYLPECILLKTDNISYVANKEIRAPFLNISSSTYLQSLPVYSENQFHSFGKTFFRAIISNSHLKARLSLPKKGFAPVGYFTQLHLKTLQAMYGEKNISQKIQFLCHAAGIKKISNDRLFHRILMLVSFI